MVERPILFSGPMVRAILEGRKTQTRRVVKCRPSAHENTPGKHAPIRPYTNGEGSWNFVLAETGHGTGDAFPCPYGQPGDRLWVRESTHRRPMLHLLTGEPLDEKYDGGAYSADGADVLNADGFDLAWWYSRPKCPSIHMPRYVCRLVLEIIGVRVERLQAISEADAEAEGVEFLRRLPDADERLTSPQLFESLWASINGQASWDANPWVWVVEFRPMAAERGEG